MRYVVLLVLVLGITSRAYATGLPVIDAAAIVQATITAFNSLRQVQQGVQQVTNQYTQIKNQLAQLQNQATNLTRFPATYSQDLLGLGNRLTGTLATTQGLSFQLSQATAQFDRLYPRATTLMASGDFRTLRQQWQTQRLEASRTAVQVQAITQDLTAMTARVTTLTTAAAQAQGNLDTAQVRAQQNGLTQTILLQQMQMQAAAARAASQKDAEHAIVESQQMHAIEQAYRYDLPPGGFNPKSRLFN